MTTVVSLYHDYSGITLADRGNVLLTSASVGAIAAAAQASAARTGQVAAPAAHWAIASATCACKGDAVMTLFWGLGLRVWGACDKGRRRHHSHSSVHPDHVPDAFRSASRRHRTSSEKHTPGLG